MKLFIVAGARPNFMKIASLVKAIGRNKNSNLSFKIIHTGQHYDYNMSGSFFEQLEIPQPDIHLNCGSGTQAEQAAAIMVSFERTILEHKPDLVVVVGDVTSTMACAIAAKKLNVKVAHVEAGIRSYDNAMPEEINRLVTDSISDYFFTTTEWASQNLLSSGVEANKIYLVGNTMIDTLLANLDKISEPKFFRENKLEVQKYFTLTLHRPSNVDDFEKLRLLLTTIQNSIDDYQVIFPVHPRTKKILNENNFYSSKIIFVDPLSYHDFIFIIKNCKGIITDSGGITEEATVLNIPCLTLRNSTERPETVEYGSNFLVGDDLDRLIDNINKIKGNKWKSSSIPPYWDGKTGDRIINIIENFR